MNLSNLSVAKKLIAAFSILGIVIIVAGIVAILQSARIERASEISDATVQQANSIDTVIADAAELQVAMRGLLVTGSSQYGKDFEALSTAFDTDLQTALQHAAGDEQLVAGVTDIGAVVDAWRKGPAAQQLKLMRHPDTVNEARAIEVTGAGEELTSKLGNAGAGFRDFTRIAASSPRMWRDVCLANREALAQELSAYRALLGELQDALARRDGEALESVFRDAADCRRRHASHLDAE